MDSIHIQDLLDKIDAVQERYAQARRLGGARFNLFSLLRPASDEVHLHSRFLAFLLNPYEKHDQGRKFLDAFLALIARKLPSAGDISDQAGTHARVHRERKSIDICIEAGNFCLVIENKIYAIDQSDQLLRYRDVKRGGRWPDDRIILIYLTLDGSDPGYADKLRSCGSPFICLSYAEDINAWLDVCIKKSALQPGLGEALVQYQALVRKLTGQSPEREEIMQIAELLENNFMAALAVERALPAIKMEIHRWFWKALDSELQRKGVRSDPRTRRDEKHIKKLVLGGLQQEGRPRLQYYVGRWRDVDLFLLIEHLSSPGTLTYKFVGHRRGEHVSPKNLPSDLARLLLPLRENFQTSHYSLATGPVRGAVDLLGFDEAGLAFADKNQRAERMNLLVEDIVDLWTQALQLEGICLTRSPSEQSASVAL